MSGPVVFAGYGITASEYGYDDYAGIDVKGKIVLVLRHEPQESEPKSVFEGTPEKHCCPYFLLFPAIEIAMAVAPRACEVLTNSCVAVFH